jgi:hypothetical protein
MTHDSSGTGESGVSWWELPLVELRNIQRNNRIFSVSADACVLRLHLVPAPLHWSLFFSRQLTKALDVLRTAGYANVINDCYVGPPGPGSGRAALGAGDSCPGYHISERFKDIVETRGG